MFYRAGKDRFPLRKKSDYLSRFVYRIDDLLFLLLRPIPRPPISSRYKAVFFLSRFTSFLRNFKRWFFFNRLCERSVYFYWKNLSLFLSPSPRRGGEREEKCARCCKQKRARVLITSNKSFHINFSFDERTKNKEKKFTNFILCCTRSMSKVI